jgi:hypothetical protein
MGPDHAGRHEGGHPTMPAEVHGFHERLSPLWHAEAGAQRTADTCAAVASMDEQLVAAETAAAPEGVDAAAWQARLGELRTQWGLLGATAPRTRPATSPRASPPPTTPSMP